MDFLKSCYAALLWLDQRIHVLLTFCLKIANMRAVKEDE
jgi:hypothetical protein